VALTSDLELDLHALTPLCHDRRRATAPRRSSLEYRCR
jgi:hypothetical protein